MTRTQVSAKLFPSEDGERVKRAIKNIFCDITLTKKEDIVSGECEGRDCLLDFKEILKKNCIQDSAYSFFYSHISEETPAALEFELNKQAAFAGKISFVTFEIVLGCIKVRIEDEDIESLVSWLTQMD